MVPPAPPSARPTADGDRRLRAVPARAWGARDGMIVLERSVRTERPEAPAGWQITDARDYGETAVYTYRAQ